MTLGMYLYVLTITSVIPKLQTSIEIGIIIKQHYFMYHIFLLLFYSLYDIWLFSIFFFVKNSKITIKTNTDRPDRDIERISSREYVAISHLFVIDGEEYGGLPDVAGVHGCLETLGEFVGGVVEKEDGGLELDAAVRLQLPVDDHHTLR